MPEGPLNSSTTLIAEGNTWINIGGKWATVPALSIGGNTVAITGTWIKTASLIDEELLEAEITGPERYAQELKALQGRRVDIFTFMQKLPTTLPKYQYPYEWESLAVVRTTSFSEWWKNLPQETRKNIRRAQKRGVALEVRTLDDDLVRGIMAVNNDSAVRQNKAFLHYGKSFDQVKFDQSPFSDRSDFICAYAEGELIGFAKIVYQEKIASVVQFLPKASHHDKRPANALLAKAVQVCEAKGMLYLVYGKFNYGNKGNNSLREFKVRNGFEEMQVPRYYVALSSWGVLYTKLKLYRGLIGLMPRPAIRFAISARAKWMRIQELMRRRSSNVRTAE